jgi:lipopolysaccharide/colanic/teichoic acid biosynthesis glycosyltransferase
MTADAEAGGDPVWAQRNDPRVTRVGRFIRATRIDELPQLVNVLAGEMSLVGPRPERPHFVEQLSRAIPMSSRESPGGHKSTSPTAPQSRTPVKSSPMTFIM